LFEGGLGRPWELRESANTNGKQSQKGLEKKKQNAQDHYCAGKDGQLSPGEKKVYMKT